MSDDPQAEKFRRDCTDAVNNHAQILREQGEMINRLQSELVFLKSLISGSVSDRVQTMPTVPPALACQEVSAPGQHIATAQVIPFTHKRAQRAYSPFATHNPNRRS